MKIDLVMRTFPLGTRRTRIGSNRSPDYRLACRPGLPEISSVAGTAHYVPLTVAGQWRILTAFPYIASGLEYSRMPGMPGRITPRVRRGMETSR